MNEQKISGLENRSACSWSLKQMKLEEPRVAFARLQRQATRDRFFYKCTASFCDQRSDWGVDSILRVSRTDSRVSTIELPKERHVSSSNLVQWGFYIMLSGWNWSRDEGNRTMGLSNARSQAHSLILTNKTPAIFAQLTLHTHTTLPMKTLSEWVKPLLALQNLHWTRRPGRKAMPQVR